MFNAGLIWRYKVDRPLTEEELSLRLKQRERLNINPADQLSVIKINSTFLESLDKYYPWKGWLTFVMLIALSFSVGVPVVFWWGLPDLLETTYRGQESEAYLSTIGITLIMVPLLVVGIWGLRKDGFKFTHYPIRLNRETRKIYVFRLDGTVLSVPWGEVFFTLGRENSFIGRGPQFWEIQGHVLDKDGVTVKETFAFHDVESQEIVKRHWEFLRRYMEEGPQHLIGRIEHYAPVDQRKETFREGLWRIFANDAGFPWAQMLSAPINLLIACGRWIAMRTSKIPQWPDDIEAACQIEPGDPYVRDARIDGGR